MTGNLLVGQSGGATAVINASLVGIIEEATRSGEFDQVLGARRGVEGALAEEFVDLGGFDQARLEAIASTPGAALGSSRHKLTEEDASAMLDIFRRHDIHTFLLIGGNDSADTVHRSALLAEAEHFELRAIAVPKTIDNDLPLTDHSPGYGSIARYVAIATMESAKDTESTPAMYPVKVIEVMGRNAGWVAAASTLGKRGEEDAPHLLYVPERPLSRSELLEDVQRVYEQFGQVVAVVAETVRDENGVPFADQSMSGEKDAFGHALLRGAADSMCRLIMQELGLRSRFDKPGSLQRMSMLCRSSVDFHEAMEVGRAAVRLGLTGRTDEMVTLIRDADEPYAWHTGSARLAVIANRQMLLPDAFLAPDGESTTDAFRVYALPLLGPDPLPRYSRL